MSDDRTNTASAVAGAPGRPGRRRLALVALLAVALVGLIVIVLGLGASSTAACSLCHAKQAAALTRSAHAHVACGACHLAAQGPVAARLDVVVRMLPSSIGGVRLDGPGREVGRAACVSCHAGAITVAAENKNGLRINHRQCTVASACEDCHGRSAHGSSTRLVRGPSMASCIACHAQVKAPVGCSTCHAERAFTVSNSGPEWARTHGADWKTMHGTGDLTSCAMCHASSFCRTCHKIDFPHPANFGAMHGALSRFVGASSCYTCHKGPSYCQGCHGVPIPHPAGFLQKHSSIASSVTDPKCRVCHVLDDCGECHVYHIHPGGSSSRVGRFGGSLF